MSADVVAIVMSGLALAGTTWQNINGRWANRIESRKAESEADRLERERKAENRELELSLVDWVSGGFAWSTYSIVHIGAHEARNVTAIVTFDAGHHERQTATRLSPGQRLEFQSAYVRQQADEMWQEHGPCGFTVAVKWRLMWQTHLGTPREQQRQSLNEEIFLDV